MARMVLYNQQNNSKLSNISNANFDFSLPNKIYGSNQSKTFELPLPTELAQRKFMNKKLNRWVSSMLQVLYYAPLQDIGEFYGNIIN